MSYKMKVVREDGTALGEYDGYSRDSGTPFEINGTWYRVIDCENQRIDEDRLPELTLGEEVEVMHLVVGQNRYPEDGFGIGHAFHEKENAEAKIEDGNPADGMKFGYSNNYVKTVIVGDGGE